MSRDVSTFLVKIGEQGLLTIAMPEMTGRLLVVEHRDGRLIISPFDLENDVRAAAIARQGGEWRLIGNETEELPKV